MYAEVTANFVSVTQFLGKSLLEISKAI